MVLVDPTGLIIRDIDATLKQDSSTATLGNGGKSGKENIKNYGCVLTSFVRMANALSGNKFSLEEANEMAMDMKLYTNGNELTPENGAELVNALVNNPTKTLIFTGSVEGNDGRLGSKLNKLENSDDSFFVSGRMHTTNEKKDENYDHQININSESVHAGDITKINEPFIINVVDTSNANRKSTADTTRNNDLYRVDYFEVIDTHQMVE